MLVILRYLAIFFGLLALTTLFTAFFLDMSSYVGPDAGPNYLSRTLWLTLTFGLCSAIAGLVAYITNQCKE